MSSKSLQTLKIIFLGTPSFALPSLNKLLSLGVQILAVITQPARPQGRGMKLQRCLVALEAERLGLIVYEPAKLKEDQALIAKILAMKPDLMVTAAYGQILTQEILDLAQWGVWNVHASLLPRWRGAAPIQRAMLAGDELTGVTIMQTELGLDSGPMLATMETKINPTETAGELTERLAEIGALALEAALQKKITDTLSAASQEASLVTIASKVKKEEAELKFESQSALECTLRVRAFAPNPGAFFLSAEGKRVKVKRARVFSETEERGALGALLGLEGEELLVQCQAGLLGLMQVQPEGKSPMSARDFWNGLDR